jgi:hypothetical protein
MDEADRRRRRYDDLRAGGMSEADAQEQALREGLDRERAHMQGTFRDTFRNGLQAAMDGDLGGFFENWMRDRSFNALADVLDKLATSLADFIFNAGQGGGGGGFLGSILGGVGKLFGGGTAAAANQISTRYSPGGLPAFDSGGSFKINGFPGIDQNLLSLNGNPIARVSQGEIMDIRRGESGGSVVQIVPSPYFDVVVDGRAAKVAAPMAAAAGHFGRQSATSDIQRRARRRIPG